MILFFKIFMYINKQIYIHNYIYIIIIILYMHYIIYTLCYIYFILYIYSKWTPPYDPHNSPGGQMQQRAEDGQPLQHLDRRDSCEAAGERKGCTADLQWMVSYVELLDFAGFFPTCQVRVVRFKDSSPRLPPPPSPSPLASSPDTMSEYIEYMSKFTS